jgi:anti-sigma regulatory factor (Ser/Thr protein kinase)
MSGKSQGWGRPVEIRIAAHPIYLAVVRGAVRKVCALFDLTEEETDEVILALEEALANVIRHGYGGPCDKPIDILIGRPTSQEEPGLEVIVRDAGKVVDPRLIRSRDLEDIRPGGLGVHIIRSVMDVVEYSCLMEGGMQLRMVKRVKDCKACARPGAGHTRGKGQEA